MGCQVIQCGMTADGVEVILDPVGGRGLEGFEVWPGASMDQFFLVGREGGLGDRVVVTDASATQRSANPILPAVLVEGSRGILRAAIGMKDDFPSWPAFRQRHVECVGDETGP